MDVFPCFILSLSDRGMCFHVLLSSKSDRGMCFHVLLSSKSDRVMCLDVLLSLCQIDECVYMFYYLFVR